MAAPPTDTFETYSQKGDMESFSNIIFNVDPFDTPFLNSIEQITSKQKLHIWQTDALTAAAANQVEEGLDATTTAVTATVEKSNTCQISSKTPRVSGTAQATETYGRANELDYQISKMSKELKRDMELDLLANTAEVGGSSGTARKLGGIQTWLITNLSEASDATTSTGSGDNTRTAGTTRNFTETMLQEVLRETWNSGGNPELILVGGFNKQKFSTFTGNATREVNAQDEALYASIDVYKSDFGELQVVPNRSASNSSQAYVLQPDMWAVAYLREFEMNELAKTGDSERVQILAEFTLEARNEKASGAVYDLTSS